MKLRLRFKRFGYTKKYFVSNNYGLSLGVISYFSDWKKYVWEQNEDIIMSWDCLLQLSKFMEELQK
jgi:hypothetical protein